MKTAWRLFSLCSLAFWVSAPIVGQTRVPVKLQLQLGHSGAITSVAISPDGRLLLTGGTDTTARLWEVETGRQLRVVGYHTDEVKAVAFSPDGKLLLTGSEDDGAVLWDFASGRKLRRLEEPSLDFEVDPSDGSIRRADRYGGVIAAKFSPDGRWIVTGEANGDVRLWDTSNGKYIRRFEGDFRVPKIDISRDSTLLVIGSAYEYSLDGTIDYGSSASLFDLATGKHINRFKHDAWVEAVEFSPNGRHVLTGSADMARLWDVGRGTVEKTFASSSGSYGDSVAFSPDGQFILTFDQAVYTVQLWNTRTDEQIFQTPGTRKENDPTGGAPIAFFPDGKTFLVNSFSGVSIWDVSSRLEVLKVGGHSIGNFCLKFSPDSQHLITESDQQTRDMWQDASGMEARRINFDAVGYRDIAFSSDGKLVATARLLQTILWDAKTLERRITFEKHDVDAKNHRAFDEATNSLVFSPDNSLLFTGSNDGIARKWDVANGKQIGRFAGHSGSIWAVAISTDARYLLTGSDDNSAKLWDVASGLTLKTFEGHTERVTSVAFSPDGLQVLTGSDDNTARLWDRESAKLLYKYIIPNSPVKSAVYLPNGKIIAVAGEDKAVRLYATDSDRELATLVAYEKGGWAVVDPEGRYDASDPDNSPGLFWLAEGDHVIELEQLKDKFYTKGLLSRIMKDNYLEPVGQFDKVFLPPQVEVIKVDQKQAEIVATNTRGGFGEVLAVVNGREVPQIGTPARFDPTQQRLRLTLDLSQATLSPAGNNVFQVLVKNLDNTIASRYSGPRTFPSPQRSERKPRLFALIAGASQYPNAKDLRELSWSAKDAMDMKKAIEIAAEPLFKKDVEIEVLASGTNKLPTKKNLFGYLEGLAGRVYPEDVLLIYFAGHGAAAKVDGNDVYFYLTADSRGANVTDTSIALDAISSVELKSLMTRKNMPLKQVLILDTCAAGTVAAQFAKLSEQRTVAGEEKRVMEVLKDRSGMHILMGSAADGLSYEASHYAQGLLTYALLLGMQTMDLGESGSIDVVSWFNFVEKKVPDLAKEIGVTQRPVLSSPKGQSFPVGMLKETAQRKQIPLSEERPVLLPAGVGDMDGFDDLRLKRALNARLIEVSRPQARGGGLEAPKLVYVAGAADEADDLPKMIKPYVRYKQENGQVIATVQLRSQKKILARTELRSTAADAVALARAIVDWIEQILASQRKVGV